MASTELPSLVPVKLNVNNYCAQDGSSLFAVPGEIRDRIFGFALASFEDMSEVYDTKTYYSRPEYLAPRKSDATLLQTCQRIYNEAWFRPWVSSDHTFWLGSADRAPLKREGIHNFAQSLQTIHGRHGVVHLDHIRFFAQLYALESGSYLTTFVQLPHFYPRHLTITIRHTDWWYWESEANLTIDSPWVRHITYPESLQELRLELESIEQRKGCIDSIAHQMRKKWHFRRNDGVQLRVSDGEDKVTRWQGSSTLNGERWIRDELVPGKLNYYVRTVVWRADPSRKAKGENLSEKIESKVKIEPSHRQSHIYSRVAELAGVTDDDPADVVVEKVATWRTNNPHSGYEDAILYNPEEYYFEQDSLNGNDHDEIE